MKKPELNPKELPAESSGVEDADHVARRASAGQPGQAEFPGSGCTVIQPWLSALAG
jgi:hypothetical protein